MKRFLTLILIFALLICSCFSFYSCNSEIVQHDRREEQQENNPSDGSGTKGNDAPIETVDGPFVFASDFREGYAFVEKHSERGTVYCIDKTGKEIFKVENYMPDGVNQNADAADLGFSNGYVAILGNLYDTTGRKITPESVGVTEFIRLRDKWNDGVYYSSAAMPGGYILAKKVTSTYNSSKQELGILNSKLEWVVPLSEEFYQNFMDIWANEIFTDFVGNYVYLGNENYYLDPATGSIVNNIPKDIEDASSLWDSWGYDDGETSRIFYGFSEEDIRVSVTVNANVVRADAFRKGKAPLLLQNEVTEEFFVTIIDENGTFLFNPVKLNMAVDWYWNGDMYFDGAHLVITEKYNAERTNPMKVFVLDTVGNMIKETTTEILNPFTELNASNKDYVTISLEEGVIKLCAYNAGYYYDKNFYYLNMDFENLY